MVTAIKAMRQFQYLRDCNMSGKRAIGLIGGERNVEVNYSFGAPIMRVLLQIETITGILEILVNL